MPPRKKTTAEDVIEAMRENVEPAPMGWYFSKGVYDVPVELAADNATNYTGPFDTKDDAWQALVEQYAGESGDYSLPEAGEPFHPEGVGVDIMIMGQKFGLNVRSGAGLQMVEDTIDMLDMVLDAAYTAAEVELPDSNYGSVSHMRVQLWSFDPFPVRTEPGKKPQMVRVNLFHEGSNPNEQLRALRLAAIVAEERAEFQRTMANARGEKPPYIPSEQGIGPANPPKSAPPVDRRPLARNDEARVFGGYNYSSERSHKSDVTGRWGYTPNHAVTVMGEKGEIDAAIVPPVIGSLTEINVNSGTNVLLPIGEIEHNKRKVEKGSNPGQKELYFLRIPKAAHMERPPFAIEVFVDNDKQEPLLHQLAELKIGLTDIDAQERWLLGRTYKRQDGKLAVWPVRLVEPDMEAIWNVDVAFDEMANWDGNYPDEAGAESDKAEQPPF